MKVSVVIPAHNREHTIRRAIASVLNQTMEDYEIVVVDDRSTDGLKDVVAEFEGVRYVVNGYTRGPSGARNYGVSTSLGKYVAFLDSDDEWSPNHLEDSVSCLETYGLDASYSLWYRQRGISWEEYPQEWLDFLVSDLNLEERGRAIILGDHIAEYMIAKPFWCFHVDTLVVDKISFLQSGMFDEDLASSEDMEFSFRLLLGSSACLINGYHAYYYEGSDNLVARVPEDSARVREHAKNTVKAFVQIGQVIESSSLIEDKAACLEQLNRKIDEYEVLR